MKDFKWKPNDYGITITCYCGKNNEVTVPEKIDGKSVTCIGESAFSFCMNLTHVAIPDTVTSIGDYAFYGCGNLRDIFLSDAVTSIGEAAFWLCDCLSIKTNPGSYSDLWLREAAKVPERIKIDPTEELPDEKWAIITTTYECDDNSDCADPLSFPYGLPMAGTFVSAIASSGFSGENGCIIHVVYHNDYSDVSISNLSVLTCKVERIIDILKNNGGIYRAWIRLEVIACDTLVKFAEMNGVVDERIAQSILEDFAWNLFDKDGHYYDAEKCRKQNWGTVMVGSSKNFGLWTHIYYSDSNADIEGYAWIYHDKNGVDHLVLLNSYYFSSHHAYIGNLILGGHENVYKYYMKEPLVFPTA